MQKARGRTPRFAKADQKALLQRRDQEKSVREVKKEETTFCKHELLPPIGYSLVLGEGVESMLVEDNYHRLPSISDQIVKKESHIRIQFVGLS